MQKLGQHFLKNKSAIKAIVDALELAPGETVIEIGPGRGALTLPLAEESKRVGASVIAVEKDEELVDELKSPEMEDLQIIHGDILEILPNLISQPSDARTGKYKLAGNIPYYITGHLLRIISELRNKPERCIFTIQKEVAERIVVAPPNMNRLAASVQYWAEPKIITALPASDFSPAPKVDSAIIVLKKKAGAVPGGSESYYSSVRAIFAQPRKTVLNNLAQLSTTNKEEISAKLQEVGIDPVSRPQNLNIDAIVAIAEKFFRQ
jgi:16S rRNA (adenine1518-N6/adenine1519-N6)-dimethyltransferase